MVRFYILLSFLLGGVTLQLQAKTVVNQLQPSSWWTNLEMKKITILVQGENIQSSTVRTAYSNVNISNIQSTQSPNFITFDLTILPNATAGIIKFEFSQNGKTYSTINFPLETSLRGQREPITRSDVIYQILPDRFANGNPANDNATGYYERADRLNPAGIHGGDYAGISQHLSYIEQLGATAIELTPVYESNQFFSSYDKAGITNHYASDARLGTLGELTALIKTAQAYKLKVIFTLLLNQAGTQNPLVTMKPFKSWINANPAIMAENKVQTAMFDPYAAPSDKQKAYLPWPETDIASLNQNDTLLRQYLIQNSIWWIEQTGVNAIKIENTALNQPDFIDQLSQQLYREFPNLAIISDVNTTNPALAALAATKIKSPLTMVSDYSLAHALTNAFSDMSNPTNGLMNLYDVLALDFGYANPWSNIVFADNYQMMRTYNNADKDIDQLKMMMEVALTVRGIPQISYGTEMLLDGDITEGKGSARKEMPGFMSGDIANAFTAKGLSTTQTEFSIWLRTLIDWRKTSKAINEGSFMHFKPENGLYVYLRQTGSEMVMVIVNNNNIEKQRFDASRYMTDIGVPSQMTDVLTQEIYSDLNNIILLPKSVTILELTGITHPAQ